MFSRGDGGPLSPEMRLLLAACHTGPRPPEPPEGRLDAERLARLAAFHRVSGLVHERRATLPLPPDALEPLRRDARRTLHRNLRLALEVQAVLRALGEAGAPVALLKGIHLMDAVYASPAHRPLSDVDLLIRPTDLARARTALARLGYEAAPREAAFGLRADREVRLVRPGEAATALDLHTDLNRPTRHHWFPMGEIWRRTVATEFEGEDARVLSPADNLVFLCAHAVPHAFGQLIWLCDIARLAPQDAEQQTAVFEAAREARARRAVWAGLALAQRLLGAAVDGDLLEGLQPRPSPAVHRLLEPERIFRGGAWSSRGSLQYRMALADSRADAASVLAAVVRRKASETLRGLTPRKARGQAPM